MNQEMGSQSAPPQIAVQGLTKSFGDQHVLSNISFEVNHGEIVVLLGSSGSGKSTLLQCMNCLVPADAGTLRISNVSIPFEDYSNLPQDRTKQLRSKVGMVFQRFNLWPHMTVLQNLIEAPIRVLKMPKEQAVHNAHEMLDKVGIAHMKDKLPSRLSGGEQQRVAIARSLMMNPEVMLFDEPTSALDPETVNDVLRVMQQLAQEGMTMLVATHELNFAREVAHRVFFLEQGQIVEQGGRDILLNPQTPRFKQFLNAIAF